MPDEDNKTLKYNHGEKSLKVPFIVYADLKCLLQKTCSYQNYLEKSCAERKAKHIPSGDAWCTISSFDASKNERGYYREQDKKFFEDFRNGAIKIINYKEKEMISLTDEETKSYEKQKVCRICKKEFITDKNDENKFELHHKVRDHCHFTGEFRGAAHNICNLRYKISKEIPVVFHNGSTYDYHFMIKKLEKEFDGQFECLGENTEKHITFSVPIKKELNNGKTITYKLKFIDSFRFMIDKLLTLVDNLSEINKKECKGCMDRKKIKSEWDIIRFKNKKLNCKCKECGKRCFKSINESILQGWP